MVLYDTIKDMNDYKFSKPELQPADEGVNLDTEWGKDYHLDHAEWSNEALLSMKDEKKRKPEMEKDATKRANMIINELYLGIDGKCKKMVFEIGSVFNSNDVRIELPNNVDKKNEEYSPDFLVSNCLRFNRDSIESICRSVSNGIFDVLGLTEDKRPFLNLVESTNGRVPENKKDNDIGSEIRILGNFLRPRRNFHNVNPAAEKNGIIRINLPSFGNYPDIRKILAILVHECFHVYQFNCEREVMPITTARDMDMAVIYRYGHEQYISYKNDFAGYYNQGYESSARIFSTRLRKVIDMIIMEMIKIRLERIHE